jgi:hypothetical protein
MERGEPGGGLKPAAMPEIRIAETDSLPRMHSKLLNMRYFRASEGFPSRPKRATIKPWQPGKSIGLAYFRRYGLSCQNAPLARPSFVPTCSRLIHDVISAVP